MISNCFFKAIYSLYNLYSYQFLVRSTVSLIVSIFVGTSSLTANGADGLAARLKTERLSLPVHRARSSLLQQLCRLRGSTAIVIGETGSGKTTQIPQVEFFSYFRHFLPQSVCSVCPC